MCYICEIWLTYHSWPEWRKREKKANHITDCQHLAIAKARIESIYQYRKQRNLCRFGWNPIKLKDNTLHLILTIMFKGTEPTLQNDCHKTWIMYGKVCVCEKCLSGPGKKYKQLCYFTLFGVPSYTTLPGKSKYIKARKSPMTYFCLHCDWFRNWKMTYLLFSTGHTLSVCPSVRSSFCLFLFAYFLSLLMLVSFFFVLLGRKPNWGRGNETSTNDPKF